MKNVRSESRARTYVKEELKKLGWNTNHPSREGNLLEENEINRFDVRLKENFKRDLPDFLLWLDNEPLMIIETKSDKLKFDEACKDAKFYSDTINKKYFNCKLYCAVAGNSEEGVIVRTFYKSKTKWKEVKSIKYPITQILTKDQIKMLFSNVDDSLELKIPSEIEFYSVANRINQIFHEASVNKNNRAVYLGSIILAISEGEIDTRPNLILKQINSNMESALEKAGKKDLIKIFKITGDSNKLKKKLPLIFHNLERLNIRALMNTEADILGKFFETFLRYGNDAKDLGIVFTPRHVVDFMIDLVNLSPQDVIYDPTCGTGGFLVASFMRLKKLVGNNKNALNKIKKFQILGTDDEDTGKIPALAVVNMIFRGDGKSNIYNEDCFTSKRFENFNITKVFLNPPYAKNDDDEPKFIDHSLNLLQPGGIFASIFTYANLGEKSKIKWRQNLLRKHKVEAVITMLPELFYPTSAPTVIMIARAHVPHSGKIFFAKVQNDGFTIFRKKRVEMEGSQLQKVIQFYNNRETLSTEELNVPLFSKYLELKEEDVEGDCELLPEAYIDSKKHNKEKLNEETEQLLLDFSSFYNKYYKKLKNINKNQYVDKKRTSPLFAKIKLSQIFDIRYGEREIHSKLHLKEGDQLVISSKGVDNGCYGFYDKKNTFDNYVISLPNTGSINQAFVQEFNCSIDDNCLVLIPKKSFDFLIEELYFIAACIRSETWRFQYGRQVTDRRYKDFVIDFSLMNYKQLINFRKNQERSNFGLEGL